MFKSSVSCVLASALIFAVAGCASSSKQPKSSTTASSNPFLSASKKVQTDVTQTETDLGQLESQAKFAK